MESSLFDNYYPINFRSEPKLMLLPVRFFFGPTYFYRDSNPNLLFALETKLDSSLVL